MALAPEERPAAEEERRPVCLDLLCRGRWCGNTEPAVAAAAAAEAAAVAVLGLTGRSETTGCPRTTPILERKEKEET